MRLRGCLVRATQSLSAEVIVKTCLSAHLKSRFTLLLLVICDAVAFVPINPTFTLTLHMKCVWQTKIVSHLKIKSHIQEHTLYLFHT